MVTIGVTKAITNLKQAHQRLGLSPSLDPAFFHEWLGAIPSLTNTQKFRLDHLKQRYLHYADSGSITEGTVNLILLAPLLDILGFMDPPHEVRSEKYVRFEIEDGDTTLDGLIDALILQDQLWLILIESKRYGFSVRQALAQTLTYMAAAPQSPSFALITTGEDYLFVKCDRQSYALSDKFTLSTATGNDLYPVAQILQHLASMT
jgi:predicted type IV restriction endonuclease